LMVRWYGRIDLLLRIKVNWIQARGDKGRSSPIFRVRFTSRPPALKGSAFKNPLNGGKEKVISPTCGVGLKR